MRSAHGTHSRRLRGLALAAAFAAVLAGAPPAHAFVHDKTSVSIPMRDGKSLAADVYLPASSGQFPTILIQTPYNKLVWEAMFLYEVVSDPLFKSSKYAFVVLDWRGFFGSGAANYSGSPTRGEDGYDAVEWIAARPWSNGKVGGWGDSALGLAVLATAQESPPHLAGGVPLVYHWREYYDEWFPGGVYQRNRNQTAYGTDLSQLDHPLYDSYWTVFEANTGLVDQVKVPMLHLSGWYDHETDVTLREMERVQSGGALGGALHQKALIGPWAHSHTRDAQQGQLAFPDAASAASGAALEFFDFVLRGVANGYDQRATYRYYQIGEGRWAGASSWPPTGLASRTFYLRADGALLGTAPGAGEPARSYVSDPANPVPTVYGAVLDESETTQGPGDLRSIESRSDVLAFTTPPLGAPLAIVGRPSARLYVAATSIDTDLAVRLTQVRADGSSTLIVDAIQRASLRNGPTGRSLLTPGAVYSVDVALPSVAITIPAGDRLRMLVAPSNYDRFDRNMQDGSALSDEDGAVATPATVQLFLDASRPSQLTLPVTAPSAPPAVGSLAPIAGTTNATYLTFDYGGSLVDSIAPDLEASSRIQVRYDPADARLTFTELTLEPDELGGCAAPLVCIETCNEQMTLAVDAPFPEATVQPDGSFAVELALDVRYGQDLLGLCLGQNGLQTATATLAGKFVLQQTPHIMKLTDITGAIEFTSGKLFRDGTAVLNFQELGFELDPIASPVRVGTPITLTGNDITPGSVLKVFVATSSGGVDVIPNGLVPTETTPETWSGTLPWPWPTGGAGSTAMGNGFATAMLVRTDRGYDTSPPKGFLLWGNAAAGVPTIAALNSVPLAASSWDPSYAAPNVEIAVLPGATLTISGDGFSNSLVNLYTASGNIGPLTPSSQDDHLIRVTVPPGAPVGPGSVQVVNPNPNSALSSNAVSVPIGERIAITGVTATASRVSVTGTGFSSLTVVNLFGWSGGAVANLGGLAANGSPKLPLDLTDSHHFSFARPAGLDSGPAYVQALNPPYVPYSRSSGSTGDVAIP